MPGASSSGGGWSPAQGSDDGWGPSTAVHGGTQRRAPAGKAQVGAPARSARGSGSQPPRQDDWTPAGPAPRDQQRANRAAERRTEKSVRDLEARRAAAVVKAPERGLPAWGALLVLLVVAGLGGIVDTVGSIEVQGGFNIGIVVASIIAILVVKRSHMFPVVIAPPIVYTIGAGFQYYLKASGGDATKAKLDAAANYLVYGFPAIAAASAAVLIIAGLRMITRK